VTDRLYRWLHRTGIARVVNSGTSGDRPDVDQLLHTHRWTPRRVVVWAAHRDFVRMYASKAAYLHLDRVRRHPVAADGTRRWRLYWRPTR
jgi:hypothetical protein